MTYPSALHREWSVAALQRGKHVFCERGAIEASICLGAEEEISLVR